MTRDEIMKLEAGREMDKLVATKVMELEPCDKWQLYHVDVIDGARYKLEDKACNHPTGKCYPEQMPPAYSTNIEAAWRVVEKLSNKFSFAINNDMGYWYADFWNSAENMNPTEDDTAPLAICRAALLAKESEE